MLSVILKSSVRGLGKAGEIAKVRPGYARYLLADGKAVRATKDNVALLEQKLALIEEENSKKLAEARGWPSWELSASSLSDNPLMTVSCSGL